MCFSWANDPMHTVSPLQLRPKALDLSKALCYCSENTKQKWVGIGGISRSLLFLERGSGHTFSPSGFTYLQDFILQHWEFIGISRSEIVADFGISLRQSHSLCLKIPEGEKKKGVLMEAHLISREIQVHWQKRSGEGCVPVQVERWLCLC